MLHAYTCQMVEIAFEVDILQVVNGSEFINESLHTIYQSVFMSFGFACYEVSCQFKIPSLSKKKSGYKGGFKFLQLDLLVVLILHHKPLATP